MSNGLVVKDIAVIVIDDGVLAFWESGKVTMSWSPARIDVEIHWLEMAVLPLNNAIIEYVYVVR